MVLVKLENFFDLLTERQNYPYTCARHVFLFSLEKIEYIFLPFIIEWIIYLFFLFSLLIDSDRAACREQHVCWQEGKSADERKEEEELSLNL